MNQTERPWVAPFSLRPYLRGDNGVVTSTLTISNARLLHNAGVVRAAAGSEAEVLAVVKADGYGHGAAHCAVALRGLCSWFGVTDVEEAITVRGAMRAEEATDHSRILIMCGMLPQDAVAIVEHNLTPVVWTPAHVLALSAAAKTAGAKPLPVHLEIDTGMSRQGVALADFPALLDAIDAAGNIACEGLFGHLACAEVAGAPDTAAAESALTAAFALVQQRHHQVQFLHLENTSGVDEGSVAASLDAICKETRTCRMVRTGIALYGYALPLEGTGEATPRLRPGLLPVMTWTAPIIGVRSIAKGAAVGYGATFHAEKPMRLALIPVGYADGFRREASSGIGNGWVKIAGQRAPVVGRVSMNLTVVDITDIANVEVGETTVLLGEGVTAEDHARWAGTIAYDILCGVRGHRIMAA